jgi:hypothetical protein
MICDALRNPLSAAPLSDQETVKADWMPPADARLGLVTRKHMLDDAKESKVVKVIRARQSVTGK